MNQTAEEEGISYLYVNDDDSSKTKPFYIGTKRYAGMYCRTCERWLGLSDEKTLKIARALRKADKNDQNINKKCPNCGVDASEDKKNIIVPCCSFDWHVAPHLLRRLLTSEQVIGKKQTEKKEKPSKSTSSTSKSQTTDEDDDSSENTEICDKESKEKQKKSYKDAILQIESERPKEVRNTLIFPTLSRKGHVETQYGQAISLEDFFEIVEPCVVQFYDRIPKNYV